MRRGKDVPIDLTLEKVTRCRENLVRQGIEAKKDLKKASIRGDHQTQLVQDQSEIFWVFLRTVTAAIDNTSSQTA